MSSKGGLLDANVFCELGHRSFTSHVIAEHAEVELDSSAEVSERLLSLEPGEAV